MVIIIKCPKIEEFHFRNQIGKWSISKTKSKIKNGAFKKHVIKFETEKEPKLKFYDFGAFAKNAYAIM